MSKKEKKIRKNGSYQTTGIVLNRFDKQISCLSLCSDTVRLMFQKLFGGTLRNVSIIFYQICLSVLCYFYFLLSVLLLYSRYFFVTFSNLLPFFFQQIVCLDVRTMYRFLRFFCQFETHCFFFFLRTINQ